MAMLVVKKVAWHVEGAAELGPGMPEESFPRALGDPLAGRLGPSSLLGCLLGRVLKTCGCFLVAAVAEAAAGFAAAVEAAAGLTAAVEAAAGLTAAVEAAAGFVAAVEAACSEAVGGVT